MAPSRKRQPVLTRLSVATACILAAILACTVIQPSGTAEAGDVVCTLFLKASFRSMFLVQDDPIRVAEDNNLLCDMCSRLARLAIGSINDERVSKNWRQVVRDRGCSMEIEDRLKDCSALTEAVLSSQSEFFTSDAVKLSPEETNTTETLSLAVQSRSVHFCRNIRCCKRPHTKKAQQNMNPAQAPPNSNFPGKNVTSNALLANSSIAMQKQVIAEDRAALNRDLELMDAMKDNLDKYNQRLSKERARLEGLDKKLKEKEKEILTGVMRERMIKKAKELEEKAAEESRKRKAQEEADDIAAENAEAIAKGKGNAKLKPETAAERVAREKRTEERKKRKEREAYEKKKLLETKTKADAAVAAANAPAGSTAAPGTAASGVKFKSRVHETDNNNDDERDDDREREGDDEGVEEDEYSEEAEDGEQADYAIAQPGDQ